MKFLNFCINIFGIYGINMDFNFNIEELDPLAKCKNCPNYIRAKQENKPLVCGCTICGFKIT